VVTVDFPKQESLTETRVMYNEVTSNRKEVKGMPTLKHLIEELKDMEVEPDEIRMPGVLYDDLVNQAEDVIEQNPDDEE
jgi:hypothetical protein